MYAKDTVGIDRMKLWRKKGRKQFLENENRARNNSKYVSATIANEQNGVKYRKIRII